MNINEMLSNYSFDVLDKLFETLSEDLAGITEEDKKNLDKTNKELDMQYILLNELIENFNKNRREELVDLLSNYIDNRDYIGAYYNQKYFKERSKNWN